MPFVKGFVQMKSWLIIEDKTFKVKTFVWNEGCDTKHS